MFEIITIDELIKRLDKYSHKELHIHHTWKPEHKDFNGSNGIALQNAMRNYHVNSNKWQDIGQHVTLLPDGLFVTGRNFGTTPASIKGYNTGSFAMEMLGNFDIGYDKFEVAQKESALKLTKYFLDKSRYVRFHRENSGKTCPGSSIDKNTFLAEARGVTASPVSPAEKPVNVTVPTSKIKEIQATLNYRYNTKIATDDIYGPETKKALIKGYQTELNRQFDKRLYIDGIFGNKTRNACVLVKKKAKGNLTWIIQACLHIKGFNISIDSDFGDKTDSAVRTFQAKNGLTVDGKVGKQTWEALLK